MDLEQAHITYIFLAAVLFERTGWVSYPGSQWGMGAFPDNFECSANDAVDAQGEPNGLLGADGNQLH